MFKAELKGDSKNPYHMSVGAVVRDKDKIAIIYKMQHKHTLLRETAYIHESIADCLTRGAHEELGVSIQVHRFLGGLITYFDREGSKIEKSTIYFEMTVSSNLGKKNQEDDEIHDSILWLPYNDACNTLAKQNNPELKILRRVEI